jgi:hypothetical protein
MRRLVPLLLLLMVGCSKAEMARMSKKTGEDAVSMARRYQQAPVSEVEACLNDYLALADEYERRGWGKYGSPGWIHELRGLCEGRLAALHRALGNSKSYRAHMDRALAHTKKANPGTDYVETDILERVERLDAANIQPNWRKQFGQQIGAVKK